MIISLVFKVFCCRCGALFYPFPAVNFIFGIACKSYLFLYNSPNKIMRPIETTNAIHTLAICICMSHLDVLPYGLSCKWSSSARLQFL